LAFSTDSDQTSVLLERVAAGNPAALDRLLRLHRGYLRRVVQGRMEPALTARVDASDVVQETQVVIAKRIGDFIKRRPTSFRIWIRQKALEQLIDQRRRHIGAEKRSVLKEKNMSDVSSMALARKLLSETPSKILGKLELQEQVRGFIEQLSENDREVLTLRHVEGLSNNEVADILKIDPNTSRQRYGRALRRLHQRLAENDIGIDGV
jgi:RNA polymerase sigma-70 factor (ECF subfamily)